MRNKIEFIPLAFLLIFALTQAGCSISMSVESSSESVSTSSESITSISTSSSASSNGEDNEEEKVEQVTNQYEEDIAALTVLYLRHEKNDDEFKRQIAAIAGDHGINDWEQEDSTFRAMGIGLKRAGTSKNSIQDTPYFKALSGSDYKLVVEGYQD
jgi:hypothetical protein